MDLVWSIFFAAVEGLTQVTAVAGLACRLKLAKECLAGPAMMKENRRKHEKKTTKNDASKHTH